MKPFDLVWKTSAGLYSDFEKQYVENVLLADVPFSVHESFDQGKPAPANPLVIFSAHDISPAKSVANYLSQLQHFSLIHLSDEMLHYRGRFYPQARVVLRSYYNPIRHRDNVFAIPLGFKSGMHNPSPASAPGLEGRDLIWNFAGQVKYHRKDMLEALQQLTPNFTKITNSWNSDKGLNLQELAAIHRRSIFVPCPFGNHNPDSFRIMEALEWGAIPVVVKFLGSDYYSMIFGRHPFVLGKDWLEAAEKMKSLLADRTKLETYQLRVMDWYSVFKKTLSADVARLLADGPNAKLRGEQFQLQAELRKDRKMKLRFALHFGFKSVI